MAFGIPVYEKPGFEADDLIGSLAEKIKTNPTTGGIQTIIMTGDLDTLQLVDGDKVVVFTLRKGVTDTVIYNEGEVKKRYGLKPSQLNDFKGLKGDPSDNIPGVPGIGEKTASELIKEFKNLENLYQFLESQKDKGGVRSFKKPLTEKLVQKLLDNKDMAFFSKKLATIIRNVDVDFELEKSDWIKNSNRSEVERLFKESGLYSLVKRLDETGIFSQKQMSLLESGASKKGEETKKPLASFSKKETAEIVDKIHKEGELAFSIQNDFFDIVVGGKCVRIPWPTIVKNEELLKDVKTIFESEKILKVSHDFKETAKFLFGYGIELIGPGFDTKLAAYLLNSDRKDYSLDRISFDEFREDIENGENRAIFISRLKEKLSDRLKKEKLEGLFNEIEVPVAKILAEMELRGILINSVAINKLSKLVAGQISDLEKDIYKLAGTEFNINSPQQLSEILFEKLGLKGRVRKTGKGALSTAAPELEKLADEHPIIDLILKYREVQKLKTTYIEPFPSFISKTNGRLHTTYNQTGTTTGRLASQEPNLQNIPVRTELGQEFRKAFIASPGYKLVSFDYSQLELRIAAHISKDEKMTAAFKRGEDIHTRTAAEIFGVKPEMVDKNMRRDAKVLNFGVLYGMGILGFQRASGVSRERAREFIDRYLKEFSGVAKYMSEMKTKARRDGYVSTIFGRRRWFPEIRSSMPQMVNQAERMAINMPIQGTAADLMKLSMIQISDFLHDDSHQDGAFLLLQVHDELLFEVKKDLVEKLSGKIRDIMENVYKLDVPLVVDVKYGDNWANLEPI